MRELMQIGNNKIGSSYPVFIIAEAGVNHNGNVEMAKALVRSAKACGADCVKFQTFKADSVVIASAQKANYQMHTTDPKESQFDMLKKLELSEKDYYELICTCKEEDILFLSTPYCLEDVDFLDSLGVSAFKIASGQVTEPFFLKHVAEKGKPIILSTGMCSLGEVEKAVYIIREEENNVQLAVLQCTSNYPSSIEDANIRAMVTMGKALNLPVGYSDHTVEGVLATTLSVAMGATIVEKHFTLDKNLPGPDHSCSSDPVEFRNIVKSIRKTEVCLGSALKSPAQVEKINAVGIRRSLVAKRFIAKGNTFTTDNLIYKRPAEGLTGSLEELVLGKCASQDISADTMISLEMVE